MKRMKSLALVLAAAAGFILTTGPAQAVSIGVNFVGGRSGAGGDGSGGGNGELMLPGDSAGVFSQMNWNNAVGSNSAMPLSLVDGAGAGTGAQVSWSGVPNSWTISTGAAADGNGRLMNGYLDTNNSGGSTAITVNNVPYSLYDVYIYKDGDAGSGRSGDYTVNGITQTDLREPANWPVTTAGGGAFTQATTGNAGNYALFEGVSGNILTINADESADGGGFRAPVNGFQIVAVGGAVPTGFLTVDPVSGKVFGAANAVDAMTGAPLGNPVTWTIEVSSPAAGLDTQWIAGTGNVGLGGIDATFAGSPALSVPEFKMNNQSQDPSGPNFGGPVGFPDEIVAAGGTLTSSGNRSVRWTGQIFIPEDGTYNFKDGIDQTTRLRIDGQQIIADSQWTNFNGIGGDNGGSPISPATFNVADGGEWLDFEFVMSEDCCGNQSALYWDFLPADPNDPTVGGTLGGNPDFPSVFTDAAGLEALIPGGFFRSLEVTETLSGTGPISGAFMDALGTMLFIDPSQDQLRLTVEVDGRFFTTTQFALVPEPATATLGLMGLAALAWRGRRRRA